MIIAIIIWLIGCFLVPTLVKPLEVGYGVMTIAALIVWTIAVVILAAIFI